jgi:hypothetical protein
MDQVWAVIQYLGENPFIGLGIATALLVVYHLLNRKSRLVREAEQRIEQLRKERGDYYRTLRPLR